MEVISALEAMEYDALDKLVKYAGVDPSEIKAAQSPDDPGEEVHLRKFIAANRDSFKCEEMPTVFAPKVCAFAVVFKRLALEEYHTLERKNQTGEASLSDEADQQRAFEGFVIDWCVKFHKEGFTSISIVERTEQTADRLAVILKMDEDRIREEHKTLEMNRWISTGTSSIVFKEMAKDGTSSRRDRVDCAGDSDAGNTRLCSDDMHVVGELEPSSSDRIFVMAHILSDRHRCGLGALETLSGRAYPFDPVYLHNAEFEAGPTTSNSVNVFHSKDLQQSRRTKIHRAPSMTMRPDRDIDPRFHAVFPLKDYEWIHTTQSTQNTWFKCFGGGNDMIGGLKTWLRNFSNRDDAFIDALEQEYGARVGFYFAFLSTYTTMNVPLAAASLAVMLLGFWLHWLNYLRLLGILGMGTASVWCPAVVCTWRQRSNKLLHKWKIRNTANASELLERNPNYRANAGWWSWSGFMVVLSTLVAVTSFIVVATMSFILIEADNALVTTPVCDSFFSQQQREATGGGLLAIIGVDCFDSIDSNPNPASDRGLYCIISGIIAGLAIDLVYTNVFAMLAYWMADHLDAETVEQKERMRIRLLFPFEWVAFMSYFLLAALLVPFNQSISKWFYALIGLPNIHHRLANDVTKFGFRHFNGDIEVDSTMTSPAACQLLCEHHTECVGFSYEYDQPSSSGISHTLARDPNEYYHECYLKGASRTEAGSIDMECMVDPFSPWVDDDPDWIGVSALAGCDSESCFREGMDYGSNLTGYDGEPCGFAPLVAIYTNHIDHPTAQVSAAAFMAFWEYNSRIYTTLDSLMIGPLIVAVWVGFVIRNLLPLMLYNRLRWVAAKRGRKVGRCAQALVSMTCCWGGHTAIVEDCLQHEDETKKSYENFRRKLAVAIFVERHRRILLLSTFRTLQTMMHSKTNRKSDLDSITSGVLSLFRQQAMPEIVKQPTDLPGWSANWSAKYEQGSGLPRNDAGHSNSADGSSAGCRSGRCRFWERCCRCGLTRDDELSLQEPANALFVESELPIYDPQDEYDELATQFSYVSVFTIVIPIGALMSLCRNVIEVHGDALHAFRDFRRPIPRMVNSESTIGEWENMFSLQVYLACALTTGMFCFCTGHLEAFSEFLATSLEAGNASAVDDLDPAAMGATWLSCQPTEIYDKVWEYGPNSECAEFQWDTADTTYAFAQFMAPNLQCWERPEHRAPKESWPPCMWHQRDFDALERGMGFHQLSIRWLTWLLLLLLNLFVVGIVGSHSYFKPKTKQQVEEEDGTDDRMRKYMARLLFPGLYQRQREQTIQRLGLPLTATDAEIVEKQEKIVEEERHFNAGLEQTRNDTDAISSLGGCRKILNVLGRNTQGLYAAVDAIEVDANDASGACATDKSSDSRP